MKTIQSKSLERRYLLRTVSLGPEQTRAETKFARHGNALRNAQIKEASLASWFIYDLQNTEGGAPKVLSFFIR